MNPSEVIKFVEMHVPQLLPESSSAKIGRLFMVTCRYLVKEFTAFSSSWELCLECVVVV